MSKKKNSLLPKSLNIIFWILALLLLIFVLCSCASSRVTYTPIENGYTILQQGQADIEADVNGTIKITNPQSTIKGFTIEVKEIFKSIFSGVGKNVDLSK